MSSDDQVRPYHAEDKSRGQEAADAVAAVLEHAAERDRAAHEKPKAKRDPRWMLPLAINLGVFAMYLLIAPPAWVVLDPIEPPSQEAQGESLRIAMWLLSQSIDTYHEENGQLPATLTELGRSVVEGVDYLPRGAEYQLVGSAGQEAIVYDSADTTDFMGPAVQRLREGG
jgi:hypothetical protein